MVDASVMFAGGNMFCHRFAAEHQMPDLKDWQVEALSSASERLSVLEPVSPAI